MQLGMRLDKFCCTTGRTVPKEGAVEGSHLMMFEAQLHNVRIPSAAVFTISPVFVNYLAVRKESEHLVFSLSVLSETDD